jgi:ribulose-bisphosphate carboxylase large chain
MTILTPETAQSLWFDFDARETTLRRVVEERLAAAPPPAIDDAIVATYFFAFRTQKLEKAVAEISYHATSGIKDPPPGSLLAACSAKPAGVDAFDATGRMGLVHVAFPLKMMLHPDGHLTSTDVLHTTSAAIIFDVFENQDARLVHLQVPERVLRTFPGPAHGPFGIRARTGFPADSPAFGTILKPTAGITPEDVGRIVGDVAGSPLLMFIKEDEDLYPDLDYSPVAERTRRAVEAIERAKGSREGRGLVFAPHVTSAPHELLDRVHAALDAGATGVMFSETFATGAVRMVREATRNRDVPPAIYGHNAGIGTRTRAIWREVLDTFARLDGIDFRQTAPVKPGTPFLRPYGDEWVASERALTRPLAGHNPTMIARAGALDQGNLVLNMIDGEARGLTGHILYLAGSAINSIKDDRGRYEPRLGLEAFGQAVDVYLSGELRDAPAEEHLAALDAVAHRRHLGALRSALRQRYPGQLPA